MILKFTQKDVAPKLDVMFIDEAQDLSLLQWKMVKQMWSKIDLILLSFLLML